MKPEVRPYGLVGGAVLKASRHSVLISQERLAETIGVDSSTVQSWESGRRPIAVMGTMQLRHLCQQLLQLGVDSELISYLSIAVDADIVLTAIASDECLDRLEHHPLAACVMDLRMTELVAWALKGTPPRFVNRLPPVRRRGPTPPSPQVTLSERKKIESNLISLGGSQHTDESLLLRRQACFLAGLIGLEAKVGLPARASRYLMSEEAWSPSWADARSYAVAHAYRGDRQPLRDFIAHAHSNSACDIAALNYTAYWVGDLPNREGNDAFMVRRGLRWHGVHMFRHLVERLEAEHPLIDLNIHNLSLLLRSQPGLISASAECAKALGYQLTSLLDDDRISSQSKNELTSIMAVLVECGFQVERLG